MIAVIDYGAGNLRSVQKAFESLGASAVVTSDPALVEQADHVVLPGVGAFAAGMDGLKRTGLADTVLRQCRSGKPFLGICLGMQMLFDSSEEGGACAGLGVIPGTVRRFPVGRKVPHMGWNALEFSAHPLLEGLSEGENVYFVHSYYCCPAGSANVLTETEYGLRFASGVAKGNVYGLQFHPEKSGAAGLTILRNFIRMEVQA